MGEKFKNRGETSLCLVEAGCFAQVTFLCTPLSLHTPTALITVLKCIMAEDGININLDPQPVTPSEVTPGDLLTRFEKTAEFMTGSKELWIFRRFEKLHLLNILNLQDRIARAETRLATEKDNMTSESLQVYLNDLQKTLKDYGISYYLCTE